MDQIVAWNHTSTLPQPNRVYIIHASRLLHSHDNFNPIQMHDNPRHTVLSSLEPETKQTSRFNPIQFHELVTLKRLQTPQFPTIHNKSAIHLLWVCHGGQQLSLSLLPNLPLPSCPIWQGVEGYPFQLPDHHISSLSVLSGQELKDSASSYLTTILPASLI